jgi:hypothetical protein
MEQAFPRDFLSLVAEDLIARFGADLSDVTVVFPGVRASLFLDQYLYRQAQAPLWAPQYRSVESLLAGASDLREGDSIQLVAELYDTYIEVYNRRHAVPSTETLDEFFFFGEILLNDFDDVDKNRVDPHALFGNLKDLDALRDTFSHLSDEQLEAIERHFRAFRGESALKTSFWNIWNLLEEIYFELKEKLKRKNLAYPGMLMRSVVEDEAAAFPAPHYAFVGFNVLSRCEEQLFRRLKSKALFYWDYDAYYLRTEAGRFIRDNILRFGSALDETNFTVFLSMKKKITFLASPSESGQAAVVDPWVESLKRDPAFTQPDAAIVLCKEALLPAVIHAIPPHKVENVNITMGFPMTQTAVASFIQVLIDMQTKAYRASDRSFRYRYVLPALQHPYTSILFPEAGEVEKELLENHIFYPTITHLRNATLFTYAPDAFHLSLYLLEILQQVGRYYEQEITNTYNGLYQESIFRAYQTINRLSGLLSPSTGNLRIDKPTFSRLLRKLLSTIKIPFHGEPVKGLQIMGVLETRALDFKNLLMLNVNEGSMPGNSGENTFIPQFLRTHFEMATVDKQDAVYAYYFYRLIQRAERITLVYNTDKTQTGKAEISRFLLQLLIDPAIGTQIQRFTIQTGIRPWQAQPLQIEKTPDLLQTLRRQYDLDANPNARRLSPTALNTFINCPYRFYLEYVRGLRRQQELVDELDHSLFGSIFHQAAEALYRTLAAPYAARNLPCTILESDLEHYLKHPLKIREFILQAFREQYFKGRPVDQSDFNGEQLLNLQVIQKMLDGLIRFDKKRTPFTLLGLEYNVCSPISGARHNIRLNIGGVIDRLEEKDGARYIFDYKTGGRAKDCRSVDELFQPRADRPAHIFQTFLYASALLRQTPASGPIVPALVYIQQIFKDDYSPLIRCNRQIVEDFRPLDTDFRRLLTQTVDELFDPALPFRQTTLVSTCEYCDFREMCGR